MTSKIKGRVKKWALTENSPTRMMYYMFILLIFGTYGKMFLLLIVGINIGYLDVSNEVDLDSIAMDVTESVVGSMMAFAEKGYELGESMRGLPMVGFLMVAFMNTIPWLIGAAMIGLIVGLAKNLVIVPLAKRYWK